MVMNLKYLIIPLIIVIILLLIVLGLFFYVKIKTQKLLTSFFGTSSFKEALETSEIEANDTPKSLSSMDTLYLSRLKKDFPDLNVNELKSASEHIIIDTLKAIENKDDKVFIASDKINSYIKSKIADLKDDFVEFSKIKIHKTVINKYEKNDSVATLYLASSLEYVYKKNDEVGKKIQTRFKLEYIYIIDSSKVGNVKALGLNCPNCGAPIKSLGHKKCEYCNTGVLDIVKKNWIINNIKEY